MPCVKAKVAVVRVKGFIASLKTAGIALLMATPVAALGGMVELTVGDVVSGVGVGVDVGFGVDVVAGIGVGVGM
jgi:hypothetical protein